MKALEIQFCRLSQNKALKKVVSKPQKDLIIGSFGLQDPWFAGPLETFSSQSFLLKKVVDS